MQSRRNSRVLAGIRLGFSATGLAMMALSSFIDGEFDLFMLGLAWNGVGIFALVQGQRGNRSQ